MLLYISIIYYLFIRMRSLRSLLLVWISCLLLWNASAAFSTEDFITQFQIQQTKLSLSEKKSYYLQVYNKLSLLAIRNRNNAEQSALYVSLKAYVQSQIQSLWTSVSSPTVSALSGMTIPKVDLVKVRSAWLSLHNNERATKKLTPFAYSSDLEWTATTWADYLSDLGKATHQRKNTDGYYSYNSIKNWFLDLWIVFAHEEKNGQALFTESLWWWYYTCKKTDCTDDFIKAIKTTRKFFMSEKGKSYSPHYNAIVGNFSTLGLWIVLVGNKYYLVTHYTQDLK
jgi:hypothetical protein